MEIKRGKDKITFTLTRDFNYLTAKRIEQSVVDYPKVEIRLNRSKIVDSEALICIYNMVKSNKHIHIHKPPQVMFEAMEILGLDGLINSGEVTVNKR